MRKLTYTVFVAFCASIATLLAINVLVVDHENHGNDSDLRMISYIELAEHNNRNSCWMAIEGKVYDITAYIPLHPTRPDLLISWCGKEATKGMRTKGYGKDHSPKAWAMLKEYEIGILQDPS